MSTHPDVKSADAFTRAARRIRRTGGDDLASGVFVGYNPAGNTTAFAHDELARCTSLAFLTGTNPLLSIAYAYDDGDRRTNETWSTGRTMAYGYDDAHQLTSVAASRPSDVARYRYDAAGNPVDRAELGLDVTNSFNNLNQIVTGSWTGSTVTVAGSVNYPVGSISVNNTPGTVYPDSSFDVSGVPVVPGTNILVATYVGPAYTNVPMTATDTSTVVLGDTLYSHDANGNLTSDATFIYQYDTANQLTNVIRKADNFTVLSCRYDALGRRVEAIRSDGTIDRYVYFPGTFLVLAVLDETNTPKEFYTRGPDLSGTLSSAGGIGGILACTYSSGSVLYHHADLMGNVIALTTSSATLDSFFQCTPFGQIAFCFGNRLPRYLWSSKEWDAETYLSYYGYRYYSSQLGRWLTRDPWSEKGNIQLYKAVHNCGLHWIDEWGLWEDGKQGRPGFALSERGHSDFPWNSVFDYTKEDYGWSSPFNPLSTWRHFRTLEDSEQQLTMAVFECNTNDFGRYAHQMQDFFAHYGQGYRWWQAGHAYQSVYSKDVHADGYTIARPDNPMDFKQAYKDAHRRTKRWIYERWKKCCCRKENVWVVKPNRDEVLCNTPLDNEFGNTAAPPVPEMGWRDKLRLKYEQGDDASDDGIDVYAPIPW